MVTDELRQVDEEKKMARAVGMASQGAWNVVKKCGTQENYLENIVEIGTHTNSIHHPLDI